MIITHINHTQLLGIIHLVQRKKCPYSELFWSAFSRIRTEHGEMIRISPYSVQLREAADQNNSKHVQKLPKN